MQYRIRLKGLKHHIPEVKFLFWWLPLEGECGCYHCITSNPRSFEQATKMIKEHKRRNEILRIKDSAISL